MDCIDEGKQIILTRASSLLYTLPKDLVKLPSVIFKVKVEMVDGEETPTIFNEIVNTRIIGIPLKDQVKLKIHEYTFYAKVIEDEQVKHVRQHYEKARNSKIAARFDASKGLLSNNSGATDSNQQINSKKEIEEIPKTENPSDSCNKENSSKSNEDNLGTSLKNALALIQARNQQTNNEKENPKLKSSSDFCSKENSSKIKEDVPRVPLKKALASIQARKQQTVNGIEGANKNNLEELQKPTINDDLPEDLKTKLKNVDLTVNTLPSIGIFVPVKIDETSNPFDLRINFKIHTFSVIIHDLKPTKQTSGEHDVFMQILKSKKLFATRMSPMYTDKSILIELICDDSDLSQEILQKCPWVKKVKMMEQDINHETINSNMTFEYEKIGGTQNEIFGVRKSFRDLLEKEFENMLPFFERENHFEVNQIIVTQCSMDESFLYRAKVSRCTSTQITLQDIDYGNAPVEIFKTPNGENSWCTDLDVEDKDKIWFKLFKFPINFDKMPVTLFKLKIHGIPPKPVTKENIFDDCFVNVDEKGQETCVKFKIREIISGNEVTLKTQQIKYLEKVLCVQAEGYQSLYQNIPKGNHTGVISDFDDDFVWIMLVNMAEKMNSTLEILKKVLQIVETSSCVNLEYKPVEGEICYYKEEDQLTR